jgi:hypothetical protein
MDSRAVSTICVLRQPLCQRCPYLKLYISPWLAGRSSPFNFAYRSPTSTTNLVPVFLEYNHLSQVRLCSLYLSRAFHTRVCDTTSIPPESSTHRISGAYLLLHSKTSSLDICRLTPLCPSSQTTFIYIQPTLLSCFIRPLCSLPSSLLSSPQR